MSMLNIDPKSFKLLSQHALEAYPHECCGVLLGIRKKDQRNVSHVVPCRNVHPAPTSRYSIDPAELIAAQRRSREMQLEIVGFYHSHPDHPPQYSDTDLSEANWEDCSYLIVSVEHQTISSARAFELQIDDGRKLFAEEPLVEMQEDS